MQENRLNSPEATPKAPEKSPAQKEREALAASIRRRTLEWGAIDRQLIILNQEEDPVPTFTVVELPAQERSELVKRFHGILSKLGVATYQNVGLYREELDLKCPIRMNLVHESNGGHEIKITLGDPKTPQRRTFSLRVEADVKNLGAEAGPLLVLVLDEAQKEAEKYRKNPQASRWKNGEGTENNSGEQLAIH